MVADVAFNATVINIDTPDAANFRINDYIKINDEILKITAIDTGTGQLTVDRTQFNTPLRLHASTNPVSLHCLLYTSPSPRDRTRSRMPSSA